MHTNLNAQMLFTLPLIIHHQNDRKWKFPFISVLRYVKQMFSFWGFWNFCFQFVSFDTFRFRGVLIISALQLESRFSRKKKCCYREKRIAKKFQCIQAFRESFSQSNKFFLTDADWEELVRHLEEVIPAFENLLSWKYTCLRIIIVYESWYVMLLSPRK